MSLSSINAAPAKNKIAYSAPTALKGGKTGTSSVLRPRYLPFGDAARVLGTIAVVVGHVCDIVQYGSPTLDEFWITNFFNSASRWAVPVYIMLSGSLLLDPARAGQTA